MSSDPTATPNRKNRLRDVGTIESIFTLEAQVAVRQALPLMHLAPGYGFGPGRFDGKALEDGGEDGSGTPGHDDSQKDPDAFS